MATFVNWVISAQGRTIRDLEDTTWLMTFFSAQTAFYYLAAASVASAILAVTRKNPVHSMLWVLALFLHVAGIFLLLGAEFLAAVQVIVYAGAILIFYLFVLMLLDLPGEETRPRFGKHWPFAAAAGLSFAALAWFAGEVTLDSAGPGIAEVAKGAERMAVEGPPQGGLFEIARITNSLDKH